MRLDVERPGEGGEAIDQVLALLVPTELGDGVVAAVDGEGEVFGGVVVEVKPGFGVGAPGVLGLEEDVAEQGQVGCIAGLEFALFEPGEPEAGDFAISGDFEGIAGAAVDPGVADLLGDDGEVGAVGLNGVGDFAQVGGDDLGCCIALGGRRRRELFPPP